MSQLLLKLVGAGTALAWLFPVNPVLSKESLVAVGLELWPCRQKAGLNPALAAQAAGKVLDMAMAPAAASLAKEVALARTVPDAAPIQMLRVESLHILGQVVPALESMELRQCPGFRSRAGTAML